MPVYELLGGKCRDKVRSYEAVFKFTPEEIAQRCVELKEMGFDAARLMITGDIRLKQANAVPAYTMRKYLIILR